MGRYEKAWSAQWDGHIIRVENRTGKWGQVETHLKVDGTSIQLSEGNLWHPTTICMGEFEDENGIHIIRIKFVASHSAAALCHIFINDELIGGDTQKPLPFTEEDIAQFPVAEQKQRLRRVILWQLTVGFTIVPLFYALLDFWFGVAFLESCEFILMLILFNVVPNVYKLLKLARQNPTDKPKNSTSV